MSAASGREEFLVRGGVDEERFQTARAVPVFAGERDYGWFSEVPKACAALVFLSELLERFSLPFGICL